ncbi:DUF305 domain-containing protein [Streptomyces jumonjinensis]|uniref:DUF305 domain-containing protein n=1 Tax=Streptomyces jumonjinensis TaxID=1945 RepID=UPI003793EF8F
MTAITSTARGPQARRRIALVAAVAAAGLALTACGGATDGMDGMDHGDKEKPTTASAPAGGKNPAPGAFNDADVMFAQMMIPHHEQALEMSALADGRAGDSEVAELAAEIAKAQDPEIRKMKSWLKAWGKPASAASGHSMEDMEGTEGMEGMDHGSGMSGMMSEKDMKELAAAKGEKFDRRFAQLMIDHHKGAVDMARDEQRNGRNATAKKLADDVVRTQSAEIDRFDGLLKRL